MLVERRRRWRREYNEVALRIQRLLQIQANIMMSGRALDLEAEAVERGGCGRLSWQ